jgi:exopolyphosphatase/guanosine-5'-triphosphate,3'-diphosphate pyrophosphatase
MLTLEAVETIIERMIAAKRIESLSLPGLGTYRAPVFAGGIAILAEIIYGLRIAELKVSDGALKEGLLYEMLGAVEHDDVRERTIQSVARRFHVDTEQAARVEVTALSLLALVEQDWGLEDLRYAQVVHWAARLHEIGLDIAHSRYHHHGGYLLENADLPGFARLDQQIVATLVRYHRRKLDAFTLSHLQERWRTPVLKLIVILRLAVLLNRARSPIEIPRGKLGAGDRTLSIAFPQAWLDGHPLTAADLLQERAWLGAEGFDLALANEHVPDTV